MKFLLENIFLIGIALVSGGLLLWPLLRKSSGSTALSSLEATQLINHRNAIVVDVRDEKDFAVGSLAGARNIPFANLAERAAELVRFKARPVLIVCGAGQDSAKAVATFKAQGFEEAYSLAGGIAAWKQASLPLVVAGRDSGKSQAKDPSRKSRNDGRSGERKAKQRALTAPAAEVVPAPSTTAANDAPDDAPPDRVKELS